MPSQEVLTALESLHRELEKLEPAVKHIETAQLITQTIKLIPDKYMELIKDVKECDIKFKGELKALFEKEITEVSVETEMLQIITKEIQQQIKIELGDLSRLNETIKSFHERVEKINFPVRLDELGDKIKNLEDFQKETSVKIQEIIEINGKKQELYSYITFALVFIAIVVNFIK
jgi:predicted nuclease with TOPRIM domain